ncbi:unnamed protein product, partial [Schistosoma curassoni]|uniref:Ovule protein n=1 Tax=Schistosoma curassoni TaxID=6186 RepID=A0A183JUV5_9TREM
KKKTYPASSCSFTFARTVANCCSASLFFNSSSFKTSVRSSSKDCRKAYFLLHT